MVIHKKRRFFAIDKEEIKLPPILALQVRYRCRAFCCNAQGLLTQSIQFLFNRGSGLGQ